jgi:hypothetical protein
VVRVTAVPYVDDLIHAMPDPWPGHKPELSAAQIQVLAEYWAPVFRQADREAFADRANQLFVERSDAAREEAL